jgi:hypothetical protein
VAYYFQARLQWEKDKDKILGDMVRENPQLMQKISRTATARGKSK